MTALVALFCVAAQAPAGVPVLGDADALAELRRAEADNRAAFAEGGTVRFRAAHVGPGGRSDVGVATVRWKGNRARWDYSHAGREEPPAAVLPPEGERATVTLIDTPDVSLAHVPAENRGKVMIGARMEPPGALRRADPAGWHARRWNGPRATTWAASLEPGRAKASHVSHFEVARHGSTVTVKTRLHAGPNPSIVTASAASGGMVTSYFYAGNGRGGESGEAAWENAGGLWVPRRVIHRSFADGASDEVTLEFRLDLLSIDRTAPPDRLLEPSAFRFPAGTRVTTHDVQAGTFTRTVAGEER